MSKMKVLILVVGLIFLGKLIEHTGDALNLLAVEANHGKMPGIARQVEITPKSESLTLFGHTKVRSPHLPYLCDWIETSTTSWEGRIMFFALFRQWHPSSGRLLASPGDVLETVGILMSMAVEEMVFISIVVLTSFRILRRKK